MRVLRLLLTVALVTVLLLGCTQMSAEEIAKKMQEKYESIKDYKGVQRTIIETNGKTQVIEYEFAFKKPNKFWMYDKRRDLLMVFNGNKMWTYDKKNNTVTVINVTAPSQEFKPDYSELVEDILKKFDVKLVGTEKLFGKDCYILELKPKRSALYQSIKMWIDKEYWFPLKMQISMKGLNMTTEYIDVEFNTNMSDEIFEFKPPKNVKIVTKEPPKFEMFRSVEEAQKHVQFKILTPKYTAGCELNSVMVTNNSVHLSYMNKYEGRFFAVEERPNSSVDSTIPTENADVEDVKIGDTKGKFVKIFNVGMVVFEKGDLLIRVSGNLDKDELISVAESIS